MSHLALSRGHTLVVVESCLNPLLPFRAQCRSGRSLRRECAARFQVIFLFSALGHAPIGIESAPSRHLPCETNGHKSSGGRKTHIERPWEMFVNIENERKSFYLVKLATRRSAPCPRGIAIEESAIGPAGASERARLCDSRHRIAPESQGCAHPAQTNPILERTPCCDCSFSGFVSSTAGRS